MRTASKTTLTTLGLALVALGPTLAWADAAPAPPVPNKGDTAWMLTSTALVLLMSVPALALNLLVSIAFTVVFRAAKVDAGSDVTDAAAYVG